MIVNVQEHVHYARAKGWSYVKGFPIHDKELQICFDDGSRGIFEARESPMTERTASFDWILDGALTPLRKHYFKQHWSPS